MSFIPVEKNLRIWKDGTFRYAFEWTTSSKGVVVPMNLLDYTASMEILPSKAILPWQILTTTNFPSGTGLNLFGRTGLIEIVIADVDTETITWKMASYTLFVREAAPTDKVPLMTGKFITQGPL